MLCYFIAVILRLQRSSWPVKVYIRNMCFENIDQNAFVKVLKFKSEVLSLYSSTTFFCSASDFSFCYLLLLYLKLDHNKIMLKVFCLVDETLHKPCLWHSGSQRFYSIHKYSIQIPQSHLFLHLTHSYYRIKCQVRVVCHNTMNQRAIL